ncbi:hypothetical protein F2Q68_00043222 [Brassica cretica]|uniref:Uncharacterized protein n=1 Tax=Brassica cretica TaxID=69181 RepID=A0A8S9LUB9_BRACR|nr:hypothetical protein F2Q68_00043222 [Brassica cretica]
MPLSGDKFTRPLGPNSSIANQIQTGTTILAANIRSQTRMFPKRRAKTNPLQHRETSSSPRTFQARNAAYERITNLQHRETSQTPEDSFFDEISFLDKNTFLEDQTVIRTNIFSKHILREDSKRDQHVLVRILDDLQPKKRFEMIDGKRETMLLAQDQDSNEVLDAKGIQLAYRHPETIQHTDDNFGNREPKTTVTTNAS